MTAPEDRSRVTRTHGALYGKPQRTRKRRRCDGHLAEPHWIEKGDLMVWSALPPNHPDICNDGWWHAKFCMACCPKECAQ